ncbi:hypothetical protein FACS1894216_18330 [Synergistales bacterium]|nr:hypothetical protein FACS1894216_18330 [Synergistales bacterium]
MTNKIFYGAGDNARKNLARWIKEIGEPVCFADMDSRKRGKYFSDSPGLETSRGGGYEVTSLADAIDKYPDYELWLTLAPVNLLNATEQLIERGIPKERIHYCEDVEYRRGCYYLGEYIVVWDCGIGPCCTQYNKLTPYTDKVHSEESVRYCIGEFRQWLNKTLALMSTDSATDCDSCSLLKWGYYLKNPKIKWLSAGAGFANTICNCRCIYCNQQETAFKGSYQILDGYDIHRILSDEFGASIESVALAEGEITVLPHRNKLLNLIIEKGWSAMVATNALLYNDDVAAILSTQSSALNVSLDAGTAETYHKVKGVNAFSKVIENLEKYAESKGRILLKYILLPGLNDNFEDVNGFIKIAVRLKVESVWLSHDMCNVSKTSESADALTNITERQFSMYAYFVARCKEAMLPVYYVSEYFIESDRLRMDNLCERF